MKHLTFSHTYVYKAELRINIIEQMVMALQVRTSTKPLR